MEDTMTTSTKELLARLNAYREHMNLKPLKAWKESRAKLEAAVANIPEHFAHPSADDAPAEVDDDPTGATAPVEAVTIHSLGEGTTVEGQANAATWDKENGGPVKAAKTPKPPKPSNEGTRTIPELARKLGKKEKVARAKCRRWGSKLRPLMRDAGAWRFDNANTAQVCAILGWEVPDDWK